VARRKSVPTGKSRVRVRSGIYLMRSGRYLAQFRDPGGKQHWKSFGTIGEAEAWRARARLQPHTLNQGKRTLQEVWDELLRHESSEWKETTQTNWTQQWDKYIRPSLGPWPVGKITIPAVKEFLADLKERGVGGPTRHKVRSILLRVLQVALENGEIPENPAAAPGTRVKDAQRQDPRQLTLDEATAVLDTARRTCSANDALATETLFTLGLRCSEMAGLQARDIDWTGREITVRRGVSEVRGRLIVQESTKTGRVHVIPLPEGLGFAERLRKFLLAEGRIGEAHVFQAPLGGPIRPNNWRRRVWYRVMAEAGIQDPPGTHAGRRTMISVLQSAGVPMLTIERMVGHRTLRQTAEYVGIFRADREEGLMKLDGVFGVGTD
jgi:integrase